MKLNPRICSSMTKSLFHSAREPAITSSTREAMWRMWWVVRYEKCTTAQALTLTFWCVSRFFSTHHDSSHSSSWWNSHYSTSFAGDRWRFETFFFNSRQQCRICRYKQVRVSEFSRGNAISCHFCSSAVASSIGWMSTAYIPSKKKRTNVCASEANYITLNKIIIKITNS